MQSFVNESIELHQELFDEMFNRFELNAKVIGEVSGVSEVMISRFRKGRTDLSSKKLISILNNVPSEAKEWYVSQLLGGKPKGSLRSIVENASEKEKAELLILIGSSLVGSRQNKSSNSLPQAV